MASTQPTTLRWGIISTGHIASVFVKDLLVDPKTRDVHDVVHKVVAIGSRTVEKAQEFIDKYAAGDKSIKPYGTYEGVYSDPDVDAIYIGTPHTMHYVNARDALKAKKAVLCEKPVTLNAAELRSLLAIAKENNVFFMEALWTRFQPLVKELKKVAEDGSLGEPIMVEADLCANFGVEKLPITHRILDPRLGGGALLDLGPYPLFWAILALYEHPSNANTRPSGISASMIKTPLTNVDSNTTFTLSFTPTSSSSLSAQANLTCAINVRGINPSVVIRYRHGNIHVAAPSPCPKSFKVEYFDNNGKLVREEKKVYEYVGGGWHFQADEVARCIREGKIQSEAWGWDKSLLEMEIFDEVRRQGGYVFPKGVEQVV
ncbi:hypothetical protein JAAARDRAFT_190493 [Jaapia argillacea MUCL 33604]|uniref:D-xylose 1-dehydrogenase (NADP(+), D-xylono-1,5-lactone-forming) n=1 Tax=Jaapia argillacea MUCL 33604 TaxID=933084 RepID=A0A067QE31_9AGAM|nr:hypothetical protein JAAARDRAFT_190493 [Jaapia argillacea MUCL 33604]